MSGVKGKSGRKPDPYGGNERHKKISFYVKEYLRTNSHKKESEWHLDPYFTYFKKHYGSAWQEMLRRYMREDVKAWIKNMHWTCDCSDRPIWNNKKHLRQDKCYLCNAYKSKAARRMYEG